MYWIICSAYGDWRCFGDKVSFILYLILSIFFFLMLALSPNDTFSKKIPIQLFSRIYISRIWSNLMTMNSGLTMDYSKFGFNAPKNIKSAYFQNICVSFRGFSKCGGCGGNLWREVESSDSALRLKHKMSQLSKLLWIFSGIHYFLDYRGYYSYRLTSLIQCSP